MHKKTNRSLIHALFPVFPRVSLRLLGLGQFHRRRTQTISVPEEQNTLSFSLRSLTRLNPLTPSRTPPHARQEAHTSTPGVAPVVDTHDWLDRLGSLIRMVEWDGADEVVKHVSLDDTMEEGRGQCAGGR
jgi:hypothetical protein